MSKAYPNYQNKNYYDYLLFVKENEYFFGKLRKAKPIIDVDCPESINYMRESGKLHKYYSFIGKLKYIFSKLFQLC
jgi:hypothetical protein